MNGKKFCSRKSGFCSRKFSTTFFFAKVRRGADLKKSVVSSFSIFYYIFFSKVRRGAGSKLL
jgi:hypothetical protein